MGFTSSSSLYVVGDPLVTSNRNRIAIMAAAARLATMLGNRENVDAGGLMSYGPMPANPHGLAPTARLAGLPSPVATETGRCQRTTVSG